ncbi:HAD family acid phosphatase [Streptomyces boncukensis]|uniref:Hydrolase n=1 Tax=Streptomyces boncukensis TaxID=2711219 RepID=A0A6G4WZX7_9ACTN|nr:HAD family acid phosphatase [Streptomyces boncukensis]NGO70795.1 hydrolase [Streptomyces boncukensis]
MAQRRGVRQRIGAGAVVVALSLGATAISTASARAEAAPAPSAPASAASLRAAADVDYATWQRDVRAVVDRARPYVRQRTAHADGERLAIVFDVDNTTLETDFHPWWQLPTPAVRPSLELAQYAKSRGVSVFFVTARPGIIKSLTKSNLVSEGYAVDGLYVRSLPDLFDEVSAYKTESRADIESKGYTVIASVGNRQTDLVGGHAERTFKLPDYDGQLS